MFKFLQNTVRLDHGNWTHDLELLTDFLAFFSWFKDILVVLLFFDADENVELSFPISSPSKCSFNAL